MDVSFRKRARRRASIVGGALAIIALATPGVTGASTAAQASAPTVAKVRHASYKTVLNGVVPAKLSPWYPGWRGGRMRNGVLTGFSKDDPDAMVSVKDIDGAWKKTSVRFVDVAGDSGKEAVVIISAHAGGSARWPNYVFVYDARGKLLLKWDSGRYHGDAREAVSFGPVAPTSAILRVSHIPKGSDCYMCGTGKAAWRIAKKKNGTLTMVRTAWR